MMEIRLMDGNQAECVVSFGGYLSGYYVIQSGALVGGKFT